MKNRMSLHVLLGGILVWALLAAPVQAHFLFARILPPAEGGRAVDVYFSELAEAGDPRFVGKVASTELWLQETPGQFEPLVVRKLSDRLWAHLPSSGSVMVVGSCTYGVVARDKQTPFLLRYFPKAIAGKPEELNRFAGFGKAPLEILAAIDGDGLRLSAMAEGKPLPGAEFITVDAKLVNKKLTADDKGQALWKPAASVFSVYVRHVRKEEGSHGDRPYSEIRDFATLSFTWPLERKGADSQAVALFEEALAARADWRDFPGFEAKIVGSNAGRRFEGTVSIDAQGKVAFTDNDPNHQEAVADWVEEQLGSIALHRLARAQSADRPKPVLRFASASDDNPFGPLLIFDGGKFASSYRVKDRQIMVVNRNLGKENMTITVLDNDLNKEGKFLPRTYQVQYWDAKSGQLRRTETIQNRWLRLGAWDLPTLNLSSTASDTGVVIRSFSLTGHVLNKKSPP